MKPRPPRRTLRRQARSLPPHLAHRAVVLELERLRAPAGIDVDALGELFGAVWRLGRTDAWSVSELKTLGLLRRGPKPQRLGQVLAELADTGRGIGAWAVQRVTDRTAKTAEGHLWRLSRRW